MSVGYQLRDAVALGELRFLGNIVQRGFQYQVAVLFEVGFEVIFPVDRRIPLQVLQLVDVLIVEEPFGALVGLLIGEAYSNGPGSVELLLFAFIFR